MIELKNQTRPNASPKEFILAGIHSGGHHNIRNQTSYFRPPLCPYPHTSCSVSVHATEKNFPNR
jgi:hypothetical protein